MIEATDAFVFDYDIVERSLEGGVHVAYFTAPWCGPCRMLAPNLEKLINENPGLTVVKIDASIYTELAAQHTIMSVPTLLVYAGGFQVDRIEGIKPKNVLQETFSKWL